MSQFAVIKTGGKQYLVKPGQTLKIEKINASEGGKIVFDEVLLLGDDSGEVKIGTPLVEGARVEAEVVKQGRSRKVVVFKYHSKTRYRKKKGHRQLFTEVRIDKITN